MGHLYLRKIGCLRFILRKKTSKRKSLRLTQKTMHNDLFYIYYTHLFSHMAIFKEINFTLESHFAVFRKWKTIAVYLCFIMSEPRSSVIVALLWFRLTMFAWQMIKITSNQAIHFEPQNWWVWSEISLGSNYFCKQPKLSQIIQTWTRMGIVW